MESPIKIDDLGVPLFLETLMYRTAVTSALWWFSCGSSRNSWDTWAHYDHPVLSPIFFLFWVWGHWPAFIQSNPVQGHWHAGAKLQTVEIRWFGDVFWHSSSHDPHKIDPGPKFEFEPPLKKALELQVFGLRTTLDSEMIWRMDVSEIDLDQGWTTLCWYVYVYRQIQTRYHQRTSAEHASCIKDGE